MFFSLFFSIVYCWDPSLPGRTYSIQSSQVDQMMLNYTGLWTS